MKRTASLAAALATLFAVLGPATAAHAATIYQPTSVTFTANPGINGGSNVDNCSEDWAFPTQGGYSDYAGTSGVGNAQGRVEASFGFPEAVDNATITITAPQGPEPSDLPSGAPWGTVFPPYSEENATTHGLAGTYGCGGDVGDFYLINYMVLANNLTTVANAPSTCGAHGNSACTCADAGNGGFESNTATPTAAGNSVSLIVEFDAFGAYCAATSMQVYIADVTNPVEGSYTGLQYSVLVDDQDPGVTYSSDPAPSDSTMTYTAGSPDPDTSQLSETVPSSSTGAVDTVQATNNPASGATVTATVYDSCYNPVSNVPIYIGVQSGSGQTEPVSNTSNQPPDTNTQGQASYYAWSTTATVLGSPDTFFGELYYSASSQSNVFIDLSVAPPTPSGDTGSSCDQDPTPTTDPQTVSLNVTAADPNPASASGTYSSTVEAVPPSGVIEQFSGDYTQSVCNSSGATESTTVSVDGTATVCLKLVDEWDNPEVQNSIVLSPIQSANQTYNDFKDVVVEPLDPSGSLDTYDTQQSGTTQDYDCATGPASVIPGAGCTNDEGWTAFTIQDTKDQPVSFEITDETDGYTFPYTDPVPDDVGNIPVVTFTVGPTSALTSTVNVNGGQSANVLANNSAQATITVTLLDDHGNPEANKEVELLTEDGGTGTITPSDPWTSGSTSGRTNANGVAVFTITNANLGSTEYEAYDQTDGVFLANANQLVTVNWVTGAVSTSLSTVTADPTTVVGDGQGVSTVTVTVNDVGDHPLAGETVALDTSADANVTVIPPAATSNFDGTATFEVRSTAPGEVSLPVLVGATSPVTLSTDADIDFTDPVTSSTVVSSNAGGTCVVDTVTWSNTHDGSPVADGCDSADVTATLANGSTPIEGLTVELIVGTATSGPTLVTNGSGQVTFPVGLPATASVLTQTYSVLDVSDNDRLVGTVTITFVPIPDEAHQSTVAPPTQAVYTYDGSQPAGTQTAVVTVHLFDSTGAPIAGDTVTLTQVSGSSVATVAPVSTQDAVTPGVSDASGEAQFDVTDPDVDSIVLQAADTTADVTLAEEATVNFVLRPNEAVVSTLTVAPNAVEANGSSTSTVTITLKNNGALLSGDTVSLSQGDGHAAITTSDPVSNAAGQVVFTVSDFTPESVALQATDLTTGTLLDEDGVVTFTTPPGGPLRPSVTSVSPTSGPGSGGTVVTVTGTNLVDVTAVDFGAVPATYAANAAGTSLVAISPIPTEAGAVDVTVTNPVGTSATSAGDVFTYTTAAPLNVSSVSPTSGPIAGGTVVTLSGTDFANVHSVRFGNQTASFHLNANGTITTEAPKSSAPGRITVTVSTSAATSFVGSLDDFTYVKPVLATPTVRALSSRRGPEAGGNEIKIEGSHFTAGVRVFFGATAAHVVRVNTAGTIVLVVVPRARAPGS